MLRIGIFLFFIVNFVTAQNIAVISFKNNGPQEMEYLSYGIADMLVTSLSKSTEVQIVEKSHLDTLLSTKDLDDIWSTKVATKIGKSLNVQFIIVGSFIKLGTSIKIDAKIINSNEETIVPNSISTVKAKAIETIDAAVDLLTETLLNRLSGTPVEQKVVAGNPKEEAILEWSYPDAKYTLAIDGRVLEPGEEKIVLNLEHGKHKFDIYTGGFLPKLLRTEYHKLAGGYKHQATFEEGQIKIDSVKPFVSEKKYDTLVLNYKSVDTSEITDTASQTEVMSQPDFNELLNNLENESFEDTRLDLMRSAINRKYINVDQLIQLVKLYTFDINQISAVKIAYPQVIDKDEIYQIYTVFKFDSTKEDVQKWVEAQ